MSVPTITAVALAAALAARALPTDSALDLTGLPPVRQALVFPEGAREARLADLVAALAKSTGLEIAADAQTQRVLECTIEPLENREPVPADEAYRFVETILVQNGITFSRVVPGRRPILTLRSDPSRPDAIAPLVVEADRLEELADHPALLVRTLITFEHLDARQVQTQLRPFGSSTSSSIAVGDRALIVQDTAPGAAALVAMLRAIDAVAPEAQAQETMRAR